MKDLTQKRWFKTLSTVVALTIILTTCPAYVWAGGISPCDSGGGVGCGGGGDAWEFISGPGGHGHGGSEIIGPGAMASVIKGSGALRLDVSQNISYTGKGSTYVNIGLVYNSQVDPFGTTDYFGPYWTLSGKPGIYLTESGGTTYRHMGGGTRQTFTEDSNWYYDDSNLLKMTKASAQEYRLYQPDGSVEYYKSLDSYFRITKWTDRNDNEVNYYYDTSNNILTKISTGGRDTTFVYDDIYQVTKIIDPLSNTREYEYTWDRDVNRFLLDVVVDQLGNDAYYYYDGTDITKVTDERGNDHVYEFADFGRITKFDGFAYSYSGNDPFVTTVTDSDSASASFYFESSEEGLLNRTNDGRGGDVYLYRDTNLRTTKVQKQDDSANVVYYNNNTGRVTKTADALNNETSYDYDASLNLVTKVTLADSTYSTMDYDSSAGNLTKSTSPGGSTVELYCDGDGQITKGYKGTVYHTYDYDSTSGDLTKVTDALGNTNSYDTDGIGRRTKLTDGRGYYDKMYYNAVGWVTRDDNKNGDPGYSYFDDGGVLTKKRDRRGYDSIYYYDDNYRVTSIKDAEENQKYTYYDANNNKVTSEDAMGFHTLFEYDDTYQMTEIEAHNGSTFRRALDTVGRMTLNLNSLDAEKQYFYSSDDSITGYINEYGAQEARYYNDTGNLTKKVFPNNSYVTFQHDNEGRSTAIRSIRGNYTHIYYNNNGMATKRTTSNSGDITYEYNVAGHLTKCITPYESKTYYLDNNNLLTKSENSLLGNEEYYYNPTSEVTCKKDYSGDFTYYYYDKNLNQTMIGMAEGESAVEYLNRIGMVTKVDYWGMEKYYHYDGNVRVTKQTSYGEENERIFYYDSWGNATSIIDNGNQILNTLYSTEGLLTKYYSMDNVEIAEFDYSAEGLLTKNSNYEDKYELYDYNTVGVITGLTTMADDNISFSYGAIDITKVEFEALDDLVYYYDRERLLSLVQGDRKIEYYYENSKGCLTREYRPHASGDRDSYCIYDTEGKVTWKKFCIGDNEIEWEYKYDGSRLRTQINYDGSNHYTWTFDYKALGNEEYKITKIDYPEEMYATMEYDNEHAGALTRLEYYKEVGGGTDETIKRYDYYYDEQLRLSIRDEQDIWRRYYYDDGIGYLTKEEWTGDGLWSGKSFWDNDPEVDIDDSSGYFEITDTSDLTIEAWVKPADSTGFYDQGIVFYDNDYLLQITKYNSEWKAQGVVYCEYDDQSYATDADYDRSLPVGQWSHVAMTYDESESDIKIYINGIIVDQEDTNQTDGEIKASGDTDVSIGYDYAGDTSNIRAILDELHVSDTLRDVPTRWNQGLYHKELEVDDNTIALYNMNLISSTLYDESDNDLDGAISGGVYSGNSVAYRTAYYYGSHGKITKKEDMSSTTGEVEYIYYHDLGNRLTKQEYGNTIEQFRYDDNGNLTNSVISGTGISTDHTYVYYDELGRVTAFQGYDGYIQGYGEATNPTIREVYYDPDGATWKQVYSVGIPSVAANYYLYDLETGELMQRLYSDYPESYTNSFSRSPHGLSGIVKRLVTPVDSNNDNNNDEEYYTMIDEMGTLIGCTDENGDLQYSWLRDSSGELNLGTTTHEYIGAGFMGLQHNEWMNGWISNVDMNYGLGRGTSFNPQNNMHKTGAINKSATLQTFVTKNSPWLVKFYVNKLDGLKFPFGGKDFFFFVADGDIDTHFLPDTLAQIDYARYIGLEHVMQLSSRGQTGKNKPSVLIFPGSAHPYYNIGIEPNRKLEYEAETYLGRKCERKNASAYIYYNYDLMATTYFEGLRDWRTTGDPEPTDVDVANIDLSAISEIFAPFTQIGTTNAAPWKYVTTTICHELGHALGIDGHRKLLEYDQSSGNFVVNPNLMFIEPNHEAFAENEDWRTWGEVVVSWASWGTHEFILDYTQMLEIELNFITE